METKVYIKINSNNEITEINSDAFIKDFTNWICIDAGEGNKYRLAQSQYLEYGITNEEGYKYNYKYVNGEIIKN